MILYRRPVSTSSIGIVTLIPIAYISYEQSLQNGISNFRAQMTTALRSALEAARDQFAFYAREHRAKCDPGRPSLTQEQRDAALEKALTNERFVDNIQRVLDAESLDVLALEEETKAKMRATRLANLGRS